MIPFREKGEAEGASPARIEIKTAGAELKYRDWSCTSVQSVHNWGVQATLTDLRRKAGKVIGPVIHAGQTVELTQYGQVVASIKPQAKPEKVITAKLVRQNGLLVFDLGVEVPDEELGRAIVEAVREHREEIT